MGIPESFVFQQKGTLTEKITEILSGKAPVLPVDIKLQGFLKVMANGRIVCSLSYTKNKICKREREVSANESY